MLLAVHLQHGGFCVQLAHCLWHLSRRLVTSYKNITNHSNYYIILKKNSDLLIFGHELQRLSDLKFAIKENSKCVKVNSNSLPINKIL